MSVLADTLERVLRTLGHPAVASSVRGWCALAGVWSLVFAAPHFFWAVGGRAGLGTAAAAADAALQQGWFAAYNLAAGCLGIVGALVALALARGVGPRARRWLLTASIVASVVLLIRGALGLTLLGADALGRTPDDQMPLVLLLIEPWFVLGGVAFGGLVLSQRRAAARTGTPLPTEDTLTRGEALGMRGARAIGEVPIDPSPRDGSSRE